MAHPWYAFGEEVLDVEMVHVIAPGATLVIDLVKNNGLNNVPNAVASATRSLHLAQSQGGIVSISAVGDTGGEHCDTPARPGPPEHGAAVVGRRPGHRGGRLG